MIVWLSCILNVARILDKMFNASLPTVLEEILNVKQFQVHNTVLVKFIHFWTSDIFLTLKKFSKEKFLITKSLCHSFVVHYRQKLGVICIIFIALIKCQITAGISQKLMVMIIFRNLKPLIQVMVALCFPLEISK